MKNVCYGLAEEYDQGSKSQVAINKHNVVLEVHKNEAGYSLYYRVGSVDKATIKWGASTNYDSGNDPSCAINGNNIAVEVHKNEAGSSLYYHVGTVSGEKVNWSDSKKYDSGIEPAVAMNDSGVVVEVHKTQSPFSNSLYYHVGQVDGSKINWGSSHSYDSGSVPKIAVNNHGDVVEVHQSQSYAKIWGHIGKVNGNKIDFGSSFEIGLGVRPAVALTDEGNVILSWVDGATLKQRSGQLNGGSINWDAPTDYDDGKRPSIGANSSLSVQVHPTETILYGLWYSTSLITERSTWMQDRLAQLGNQKLSELVLPAAHDAGMYKKGMAILGKTQDLSIYEQLKYGVRWFDLRPKWTGSKFVICHGIIDGPDLSEVLQDIKRFAEEGHKELALLKFSHFDNIDSATYPKLVSQINDAIGSWLVKSTPGGKRLADTTLSEYVSNGPAMMVLVDGQLPVSNPKEGFWVYRDWDSGDPQNGDLCVYDKYSDTTDFDKMKSDQFEKFKEFDGKCKKDPSIPCDMFLLSWTLTPITGVWFESKKANRALGQAMVELPSINQHGKVANMLYVDYVEYARVTDISIIQNDVFTL